MHKATQFIYELTVMLTWHNNPIIRVSQIFIDLLVSYKYTKLLLLRKVHQIVMFKIKILREKDCRNKLVLSGFFEGFIMLIMWLAGAP